jgi:hypothetical protein
VDLKPGTSGHQFHRTGAIGDDGGQCPRMTRPQMKKIAQSGGDVRVAGSNACHGM